MYSRRNHSYVLPLEKSLPEALKIYGVRLGLTIGIYGACLITFLLIIKRDTLFPIGLLLLQAIGSFLFFVFQIGLFLLLFIVMAKIIQKVMIFLHSNDREKSKQTKDRDKLTRK